MHRISAALACLAAVVTGDGEADQLMQAYGAALESLGQARVLVDCAPLVDRSSAMTVRVREGETILTEGPSAEIK